MEIEINGGKFISVYNNDNAGIGCSTCELSSYNRGTVEYCNAAYSKTRCINMFWEKKEEVNSIKTDPEKDYYDPVSKPKHYMLVDGVEVRDICKAMADRMEGKYSSFFISDYIQFLQYVLRFDQKNGVEDLKKAEWYLQKLIETENKE